MTERNETHVQVNRVLRDEFAGWIADHEWDVAMLQEAPPLWFRHLGRRARSNGVRVLTSRNVIPGLQRLAANLMHWALYLLLIVQAFVGWIATSAYRAPINVFWLFELPPIWPVDQPFSEQLFRVHRLFGIALALLICVHVAAALYHHFVRKDDVLTRMLGR